MYATLGIYLGFLQLKSAGYQPLELISKTLKSADTIVAVAGNAPIQGDIIADDMQPNDNKTPSEQVQATSASKAPKSAQKPNYSLKPNTNTPEAKPKAEDRKRPQRNSLNKNDNVIEQLMDLQRQLEKAKEDLDKASCGEDF